MTLLAYVQDHTRPARTQHVHLYVENVMNFAMGRWVDSHLREMDYNYVHKRLLHHNDPICKSNISQPPSQDT